MNFEPRRPTSELERINLPGHELVDSRDRVTVVVDRKAAQVPLPVVREPLRPAAGARRGAEARRDVPEADAAPVVEAHPHVVELRAVLGARLHEEHVVPRVGDGEGVGARGGGLRRRDEGRVGDVGPVRDAVGGIDPCRAVGGGPRRDARVDGDDGRGRFVRALTRGQGWCERGGGGGSGRRGGGSGRGGAVGEGGGGCGGGGGG